jgi:hypothetical protein
MGARLVNERKLRVGTKDLPTLRGPMRTRNGICLPQFILRIVVALGLFLHSPGFAHDLTNLELFVAGAICIAGDAKYEKTPFGTAFMKFPEIQEAIVRYRDRTTATNKCLASREWVSKGLCSAIANLDPERASSVEVDKLRNRFKVELDGLSPLFDCIEQDSKSSAQQFGKP